MCNFTFNNMLGRGGSRISRRRGRRRYGGGGGGLAPTYDFDKFSEKLHEIEKILGRWRGAGAPPKSATVKIQIMKIMKKI